MAQYTPEQLEEFKLLMQELQSTNLAGQTPPDGTYGYYTPDFSYGSYKIPYQDPTYSSGYEYARTIAGGMPFEDVVAPGMSFSPDKPMGYTQADLTPRFVGEGPVPVMPKAPTKGTSYEASFETMPYAPVGTPMPTPWSPGQTDFPGILDYLNSLDLSGLPSEEPVDAAEPKQDFFKVDQNLFNFEEIANKIDMEEVAKIDIEKINIPESVSLFSDILNKSISAEPAEVPVTPGLFAFDTEKPIPTSFDFDAIGKPLPGLFGTGEKPSIPSFIPKQVFDQVPVMPKLPMNFTGLPNIPASSVIQPRVEDIIAPIRTGSTRRLPQPGLFNLR